MACDGQMDGRTETDGNAIASTALAMRALWRALRRAVKKMIHMTFQKIPKTYMIDKIIDIKCFDAVGCVAGRASVKTEW